MWGGTYRAVWDRQSRAGLSGGEDGQCEARCYGRTARQHWIRQLEVGKVPWVGVVAGWGVAVSRAIEIKTCL